MIENEGDFVAGQGWTLLELLMVLACIGILAHLAWPSYAQHLLRSYRVQAQSSLLHAAHWMERAASAHGEYPATAEVPVSVLWVPGERYRLQITADAQSFTLHAVPIGAQIQDPCGTLSLNHLGERGVQNARLGVAACWGY